LRDGHEIFISVFAIVTWLGTSWRLWIGVDMVWICIGLKTWFDLVLGCHTDFRIAIFK
jgi:hypothetical protein